MLGYLVTQPRYFFEEQTKYRGARAQILLVFAVGLAFASTHVGAYSLLGEHAVDVYEVIFIHASAYVLTPFAIWIVATVLMTILSRFVSRGLMIGELFRLVGWGIYPLVLGGLVQSAGQLYAVRGADPPEIGMFTHLSHEWGLYRSYLESANADPVFLAATAVAIACVLYAAFLWTIAVEELAEFDDADIDTWEVIVVASIPTTLCLVWILVPFIA